MNEPNTNPPPRPRGYENRRPCRVCGYPVPDDSKTGLCSLACERNFQRRRFAGISWGDRSRVGLAPTAVDGVQSHSCYMKRNFTGNNQ